MQETQMQETHTDGLQEIITKVPSWILRWGITLFFGLLLMAAGISVLVRYPDMVKGGLKIETLAAAKPVSASVAAVIIKVFVKQGERVKKGQPLAGLQTLNNPNETYTLTAPQDGKAAFVSLIQPGLLVKPNQELFVVHPANERFYGLMQVPQNSIAKVRIGQQALIKLSSFPAETYGLLKGKVTYIADEPLAGFFTVKIDFNSAALKQAIPLKAWMTGEGDIITENISLQARLYRSITKGVN